ncbi:PAS domain-containing protein [Kitasatospora herbaricolor]|uniref:PAS domain-containing protein n=1 Tax=Kitasatospora herbaricolor TaxID=68217 RepID=UPI00174827B8|nr:PAS domain-containing protein [Kitasatospora herbaricolor]MDQ0307221.1 PAS domain-containing protein [Kitasatospora herbaricolor]
MSLPSPAASGPAVPATTAVGAAEWDLLTDRVRWSAEVFRLLGRDPGLGPLTLDQLPARLPEQDRPALRRMMTDALVHGRTPAGTLRILCPDGPQLLVHCAGLPVLDEDGQVTALRMLLRAV